jgi:hypothetical protein
MKFKIFSLKLIILVLFSGSFLNAETKISDHWNINKIGPLSEKEAIDKFLTNRKLDPIEGIWFQEKIGTVLITIDNEKKLAYLKYVIKSENNPDMNGTLFGTIYRLKDIDKFAVFERLDGKKNSDVTILGFMQIIAKKGHVNEKAIKVSEKKKLRKKIMESKFAIVDNFSSEKRKIINHEYTLKRIIP